MVTRSPGCRGAVTLAYAAGRAGHVPCHVAGAAVGRAQYDQAPGAIGGDWRGTGFHGVAADDRICLSWHGRDAGRLRCLHVLMIDGTPHKDRADGSESGALVRIEDGKAW